jgi:hypothetical protein
MCLSSSRIKTPVLFLVFNRPDTTSKVFEKIRQAKPARLYIAGDGPREGYNDDKEKIARVKEIVTNVDWPCDVRTFFREKNLGCKKGVSTAITWFFKYEEYGIILEDDCVPHLDFFTFCESLLTYYAKDEEVSVITGNNYQNNKWRGDASYYFSKYNHCWGWATWKKSWEDFQGDIKFWPEWSMSKSWLDFTPDKIERKYWEKIFNNVYHNQIDSWAYPWTASLWYKNRLTVTPNVNLVSNIGFGPDATHTKSKKNEIFKFPTSNLGKIKYTKKIERNIEADIFTFNYFFEGKKLRFPYSWIIFPYRILKYIIKKVF